MRQEEMINEDMRKLKLLTDIISEFRSGKKVYIKHRVSKDTWAQVPRNHKFDKDRIYNVGGSGSVRPFTLEDMKPGMYFRCKYNLNSYRLPLIINCGGIITGGLDNIFVQREWTELKDDYEWSTNLFTWKPCEVMEGAVIKDYQDMEIPCQLVDLVKDPNGLKSMDVYYLRKDYTDNICPNCGLPIHSNTAHYVGETKRFYNGELVEEDIQNVKLKK